MSATNTETFSEERPQMTGYTVHSGTTIKFSESWDRIFQTETAKSGKAKKSPKKKPASGSAKANVRAKRAVNKKR